MTAMMRAVTSGPWEALRDRLESGGSPALSGRDLLLVTAAIAMAVMPGPTWRVVRVGVTLVHELGHAFVGLLAGRRFTALVVRADMSGHAVTVGRRSGPGVVAMTWAGYPAPGIGAILVVWLTMRGYAAAALGVTLLALVVALPRVRSWLTLAVICLLGAAVGALWWWRDERLQAMVLLALAGVLLVGGWRSLVNVVRDRDPGSDPAALRRLTGVPAAAWLLTFAVVLGACTWACWRVLSGGDLT